MTWLRIVAAATVPFLLAACGAVPPGSAAADPESAGAPPEPAPAVSPAEVRANELGSIPVLMYHRVVPNPQSLYDRSPEDFRAELERLAREEYVPVTTAELATGTMDVPAGKHPVVLTFDDGDPSVISLGPDGRPVAGSAVQIIMDVAATYPGFRPVASMYVNADPFGGGEDGNRALRWLHENGFEIGNHTFGHTNLRTAGAEQAEQDIARGDRFIRDAVPGHHPTTLALPFGVRPRPSGVEVRGSGYDYAGALLVGANPAPSPYSAEFEPQAIPRIRSQGPDGEEADFGSTAWLDVLAADPDTRYTSDGDPGVISYPGGSGSPAERFAATAVAY
jgi:peptidoglycan/xylan/chitin deacetylase (PgdA/CDA1 family)